MKYSWMPYLSYISDHKYKDLFTINMEINRSLSLIHPPPLRNSVCQEQGRDSLHPWTGLLIKSVLVGTHGCCLLRDRRRAAFPFVHEETETTLVPRWGNPWFSI